MSTRFNVTSHDRFGIETNPTFINLQIELETAISIDRTDTKQSLIDKLKVSGRFKSRVSTNDLELQRDGDLIHLYESDPTRSDRILLVELVKDGVVPPLEIKRLPDRDGDDFDFSDLGERP